MVGLTLTGDQHLSEALLALSDELKPAVLFEALEQAGEPMRARMAQLAPRGDQAPHMADNIGISRLRRVDGVTLHDDEVAVAIGPTKGFFYGYFQERGTIHHAAQPFVRPAFDSERDHALNAIARELWAALQRALSGRSFGSRGL